jgi:hypothetical protein
VVSSADKQVLKRTAIRARVALALTCVQNVIDQYRVHDARIKELTDVLWRFVEDDQLGDVDVAWSKSQISEFLWKVVEDGAPMPDAYCGRPEFLPQLLYDALWIGLANMDAGVVSYSEESFDHTVKVLELCEQHDVPIPPLSRFARLPFADAEYPSRDYGKYGWGPAVPRSFFAAP